MDAALRDLERRWRESGAVDDHAAWLAAAVRAGVVDAELVRLAAELGHVAARQTVEAVQEVPDPATWFRRARVFFAGRLEAADDPSMRDLEDHPELVLRAAVAAGRALAPAWYRHLGGDAGAEGPMAQEALTALRAAATARAVAEIDTSRERAQALAARMRACVHTYDVHDPDVASFLQLMADVGRDDGVPGDRLVASVEAALARGAPEAIRSLLLEELGEWLLAPRDM